MSFGTAYMHGADLLWDTHRNRCLKGSSDTGTVSATAAGLCQFKARWDRRCSRSRGMFVKYPQMSCRCQQGIDISVLCRTVSCLVGCCLNTDMHAILHRPAGWDAPTPSDGGWSVNLAETLHFGLHWDSRAGPVRPASLEAANRPGSLRACGAEAMQGPGAPVARRGTALCMVGMVIIYFQRSHHDVVAAEPARWRFSLEHERRASGRPMQRDSSLAPWLALAGQMLGNWRSPG